MLLPTSQIRDHLFENVDGLKEHGISPSTMRRIFEAPQHGRLASQCCMGYINARVGMKANSYREFHQDAHYLFARNKHRREFAELFKDDISIFSMDDMNKIKVGPLAVSQYHQLRRLYSSSDMPNMPDHDFPMPGYLINTSGYMELKAKHEYETNSTDVPESFHFLNATQYDRTKGNSPQASSLLSTVGMKQETREFNNILSVIASQLSKHQNITTSDDDLLQLVKEEMETNKGKNGGSNTVREVFGPKHTEESPLYFLLSHKQIMSVVFPKQKKQEFAAIPYIETTNLTTDSLGRLRMITPHSGPLFTYLRAQRFKSTTIVTHATDLFNIINTRDTYSSKAAIMLPSDNGPDFNPMSILNSLYMYRLFKKLIWFSFLVLHMPLVIRHSILLSIAWAPLTPKL